MSRSSELVKYLSEKVSTLSADLSQVQNKDINWNIMRAMLEIMVIQTQCLAAILEEKNNG
jgi:hypothetical protein